MSAQTKAKQRKRGNGERFGTLKMTEPVTMSDTKRGQHEYNSEPDKLTIRSQTNSEGEIVAFTMRHERRKIKPNNQRLLNRNSN